MEPVTITLAGRTFRCRDSVPMWQTMKFSKSMNSDDDMVKLAGLYDYAMYIVHPDDRAAMDAHMADAELNEDEFMAALNKAVNDLAGRGKDKTRSASSPVSNPSPARLPEGSYSPATDPRRLYPQSVAIGGTVPTTLAAPSNVQLGDG